MNCFVLNYSFLLNGSTNIISYTYHLGTTKNTFAAPKSENRILNIKMLGGFLKNLRKTGKSTKLTWVQSSSVSPSANGLM